jgi:cation diffusion facilitator family transporter
VHIHTLEAFGHRHDFLGADHARNERRTWMVIGLCTAMMVVEIVGGAMFGSMALIADGLHMSTHAIAFLIAALAYTLARRHRDDERFAFGTGKFGDLAAFASAIILGLIALAIGWESITRLIQPVPIAFGEAIPIAVAGLAVNLVSALMLREPHHHHHHHEHETAHSHEHAHSHGHEDLNLRAAYVHVLADAAAHCLRSSDLAPGGSGAFCAWTPSWVSSAHASSPPGP